MGWGTVPLSLNFKSCTVTNSFMEFRACDCTIGGFEGLWLDKIRQFHGSTTKLSYCIAIVNSDDCHSDNCQFDTLSLILCTPDTL